jgi:hypothetical protein
MPCSPAQANCCTAVLSLLLAASLHAPLPPRALEQICTAP